MTPHHFWAPMDFEEKPFGQKVTAPEQSENGEKRTFIRDFPIFFC